MITLLQSILPPQSQMGKMLMGKCRTLQEENEGMGNQANEGKIHELTIKLALQKSQNAELKSQFEGLCKQIEGLTNNVYLSINGTTTKQMEDEAADLAIGSSSWCI